MDRESAFSKLNSDSAHERLQAARLLSKNCNTEDLPALRAALRREPVSWVRRALAAAVSRASNAENPSTVLPSGDLSDEVQRQIYANTMKEVAGMLLHEIEPIVGLVRTDAGEEVPNYAASTTKKRLDHLANVVEGLRSLREASSSPRREEIDVAELVKNVVQLETANRKVDVTLHGPQPMIATTDPRLLSFVLGNGLRNALDASEPGEEPHGQGEPIVISWGNSDVDYFVSILDTGPGLSLPVETALKIGKTTKKGHAGMGLTIAKLAASSLDGQISLTLRDDCRGTRFEFRWYQ